MDGVRLRWGSAPPVDLVVDAGEVVAVVGPSGVGKTTLLRTAAGLVAPLAGEVRLRGRAATVFQDARLLPRRSVLANTLFGLGRAATAAEEARARSLLARLDLAGTEGAVPAELSGGMRRRVALARALLVEPDLLLADEPFAHLDPERADTVASLVRDHVAGGGGVLLAAHEAERVADLADHVVDLGAAAPEGEPCRTRRSASGSPTT